MKKILLLTVVLMIGMLFSCSQGNENSSVQIITQKELSTLNVGIAHPERADVYPAASFTDGTYNYFFFKIGEIENAPIYFENANAHEGIVDVEFKWEEISSLENKLTQATNTSLTNTVEAQLKGTVNTQLKGELSAVKLGLSASASISAGLESSLKSSSVSTTSQSVSKAVSNTITNKKTQTFVLDKSCPKGYYRYTVCADCDVYAVVMTNIIDPTEKGKFYYNYVSLVKGNYTEGIFYSETANFKSINENKLEFDTSLLDTIDIYNENLEVKLLCEPVTYTNNSKLTITDQGVWGLEQPKNMDVLDLSTLEQYMNENYEFKFDFVVNMSEKYDGYQYIYLYNKRNDTVVGNSYDYEYNKAYVEKTYGLLCEKTFTHGDDSAWDHEFSFVVSGDLCKDLMYVRYDAGGKYDDTWYRHSIKVTVTPMIKE